MTGVLRTPPNLHGVFKKGMDDVIGNLRQVLSMMRM